MYYSMHLFVIVTPYVHGTCTGAKITVILVSGRLSTALSSIKYTFMMNILRTEMSLNRKWLLHVSIHVGCSIHCSHTSHHVPGAEHVFVLLVLWCISDCVGTNYSNNYNFSLSQA